MKCVFQLIVVFLLLISQTECKTTRCSHRFKDNAKWSYCTKYGAPGNTKVKSVLRTKVAAQKKGGALLPPKDTDGIPTSLEDRSITFEIGIINDEMWDQAEKLLGDYSQQACEKVRKLAMQVDQVHVLTDGSWLTAPKYDEDTQVTTESHLYSRARPHMYYFVLLDCYNEFSNQFIDDNIPRLVTQWSILHGENEDCHFSLEDEGSLSLNLLITVCQMALFCMLIGSYVKEVKTNEEFFTPHPMLLGSLFLQTASCFMMTMHLWAYSADGAGHEALDVLSKIAESLSEITMTALLCMLANGWSVLYTNFDIDDGAEFSLPIGMLATVAHILIAALTFADVDASHKYHDFAGIQGFVLFGVKMFLFACFQYLWRQSNKKVEPRQKNYFKMLNVSGSAYLLAIPVAITLTWFFKAYERQYIFTFVSHFLMFATNVILFIQVSWKGSSYKAAGVDALGVLPMMNIALGLQFSSKFNF